MSLSALLDPQVTSASNGKIALELLKTKTFDICFMDFLMPVMSGVDTIVKHYEWLLADHERTHNKDMLIVGLSESTTDEELKLVSNHGCHFFCAKPPETHILSSIIALKRQSTDLVGAIGAIRDELYHSGIHGCYRLQDENDERSDIVSENVVKIKGPSWGQSKSALEAGPGAACRHQSDLTQSGCSKLGKDDSSLALKGLDGDPRRSSNGGWKIFNVLTSPFSRK